jgi:hypothetical protein
VPDGFAANESNAEIIPNVRDNSFFIFFII